ncbi:MAG TPA: hypothetical protein VGJ03_09920 [Acidimicrobiales bacterium]
MTAPATSTATPSRARRGGVWFPLLAFLAIAAVLYVTVQVSHDHFSSEHKPSAGDLAARDTWYSGWLQFDTTWYVYLAEHGYDAQQQDLFKSGRQSAVAYFPAYPETVRQVARITSDDYAAAATLTTFLCGLGFALLFWRWCRDRLSPRARRVAMLLLLLYPYAWFLYGSGYGDSFFLMVTLGAFLLLERDRPVLAGVLGFVATAARPTGTAVLLGLVAVALERRGVLTRDAEVPVRVGAEEESTSETWLGRERAHWHFHREKLQPKDAGVLLAVGGLACFVVFCASKFGDPFAFATVQKAPGWDQAAGLHTWLKVGFFGHLVHDSPSFSLRLLSQALLSVGFIAGAYAVLRRFGWGYALYSLAMVGIPLIGTGDFQGMGRYLLGCFPVFAVGGEWLAAPERGRARTGTLVVSAIALVALASLFGRAYYLT